MAREHPGHHAVGMKRNERGSVVWWVVAVMGCVLIMLGGLGLVAQRAVRSAQAQGVADLAALAAVGEDEAAAVAGSSPSPVSVARRVVADNRGRVESIGAQSTTEGGRSWRVQVRLSSGDGWVTAFATAQADRVHPDGVAGT